MLGEDEVAEIPSIGPLGEASESFLLAMSKWSELEGCPLARRLAFGAILNQAVPSKEEGYRLIEHYLPNVDLDPVGSSDFYYQINRPRDSTTGISGLRINRLARWSILLQLRKVISFGPQGLSQASEPARHAARVELDINTGQDFGGTISREQLRLVLNELVSLAREIASRGDVP